MNKQSESRPGARYLYRRLIMLLSIVALALTTFASTPNLAQSYTTATGTLNGYVNGDDGPGTPVPVGDPGDDPNIPVVDYKGCIHGPGYWKEKPEKWPVQELTIGGVLYTKAQLIAMVQNPSGEVTNLIFHLMAAKINRILGQRYDGLDAAIAAADAWLINGVGVSPVNELENFNYGHRGNVHCNDATGLPDRYTSMCQVVKGNKPACASGYYKSEYDWSGKKWVEVQASIACMTQAQCQPPADPNDLHRKLPCDPFITNEGVVLFCEPRYGIQTGDVNANVSSTCPVNEVLRAPYPRALVNTETSFFLQPANYNNVYGYSTQVQSPDNLQDFVDANGNPTKTGYAVGIWRNFVLTMRSRRFNGGELWYGQVASDPQWKFTDRAWNAGPQEQSGATASYTYKTSSAGLGTTGGRGFDIANQKPTNTYNLPAYNVDINTSCGHEWKGTAEISQRQWVRDGKCEQPDPTWPPGWTPDGWSFEGCDNGKAAPGHYGYFWAPYVTGWTGVNMVLTGLDTTYDKQDDAVGGGFVRGSSYWDTNGGVKVPVVEVQSVLRSPCVASGDCEPPKAESGSVAP
jgi:hypothetical protein